MSGKMSRRKGATYELEVRKQLEAVGVPVVNRNRPGYDGDDLRISDPDVLSIELKNQASMTLSAWVDQAVEQAEDGAKIPVVIHKRKGKTNVLEHYAMMRVQDLMAMLELLREEKFDT